MMLSLLLAQFLLAPFHVVVDITSHGLGHVAQTACVVNALNATKVTIRTSAPPATLRERIAHRPLNIIDYRQDAGMIMHDALRVDIEETRKWYHNFHMDFDDKVSDAARKIEELQPDLLLSNVPYLGIQAAKMAGVPNIVAMCSLNWADVYKSYCGRDDKIHRQMLDAYNLADLFLRPEPSMYMPEFMNTRSIGPISMIGTRQKLSKIIGHRNSYDDENDEIRFVLVGVGGVGLTLPFATWPRIPNVMWIVPNNAYQQELSVTRPDILPQSVVGNMRYIDLLASVDCIVTKTGYGTQVEAVTHQIPTVCISRLDWPEHTALSEWHAQHGVVEFVDYSELSEPRFGACILNMLSHRWTKPHIKATGADDAAKILNEMLMNQKV